MINLPDVQKNTEGFVKKYINKVGVRNIKIPFSILSKYKNTPFNTIATISSYCDLVPDLKGINMSRITRTINEKLYGLDGNLKSFSNLNEFVYELKKAHQTDNVYIKASFDYILETNTPITNIGSLEPIQVIFESMLLGDKLKNYITIHTTEMSLCPCSKEMSLLINNLNSKEKNNLSCLSKDKLIESSLLNKIYKSGFGAHNQKSKIEVKIEINPKYPEKIWIEDIYDLIRECVSCPTWSTLKRPDEKYVTEVSYMGGYFDEDNEFVKKTGGPMFVEDISRNIADRLDVWMDNKIVDYIIIVNNEESIHSENIFATSVLSAGKELS